MRRAFGAFELVVVEHQFGSTTIDSDPMTVVTLTGSWTDSLLALDEPIKARYVTDGIRRREKPIRMDAGERRRGDHLFSARNSSAFLNSLPSRQISSSPATSAARTNTSGSAAFESLPGWSNRTAVKSGAVVYVNNNNAAALSEPTIYSVPYALNLIGAAADKIPA